jgi:hypothetical protein
LPNGSIQNIMTCSYVAKFLSISLANNSKSK